MKQADWKQMFKAVEQNDYELLMFYIRQGIDLNFQHPEYFTSALIESIRRKHHTLTQALLENGALPTVCEVESGKTPRQIAVQLNNTEAVALLDAFLAAEDTEKQ